MMTIGVIGAGAMGAGIAQIAAQQGHDVVLVDSHQEALKKAEAGHRKIFARLQEKGTLQAGQAEEIIARINYSSELSDCGNAGMVIEAIVENLEVKKDLFRKLSSLCREDCILASNTSSLSIASIGASVTHASRFLGIHFFNPAPLMPLVEIIPAISTDHSITQKAVAIIDGWGKTTVMAKDTPGFIVNRVARPFYGEALRIYEEGFADVPTIDWAMTHIGGFRMGPFTLMDFIGHDINYTVTETVFREFYFDPRYKPSFSQKRLLEAGWLGRKSGRGFYDYREGAPAPVADQDKNLGEDIFWRILVMLINEAADALYLNIASREDIDLAMTRGVNYPKGLLRWADEKGIAHCVETLDRLYAEYGEDRYRCSPLLRKMMRENRKFYN